jgi:RNA polymerase III RPC4
MYCKTKVIQSLLILSTYIYQCVCVLLLMLEQMQIRESGKIVLIIGGVSLDVTAGLPCYFNSEIVAINAENKTMSMFGQVSSVKN